jgi:hypothetical protein
MAQICWKAVVSACMGHDIVLLVCVLTKDEIVMFVASSVKKDQLIVITEVGCFKGQMRLLNSLRRVVISM